MNRLLLWSLLLLAPLSSWGRITPPCSDPAPYGISSCPNPYIFIVGLQPTDDIAGTVADLEETYGFTAGNTWEFLMAFWLEADFVTIARLRCDPRVAFVLEDTMGALAGFEPVCHVYAEPIPAAGNAALAAIAFTLAAIGAAFVSRR